MKRCCRCKSTKQLSEFNKSRSNIDGLDNRCRECQNAKRKQEQCDAVDYVNHPKQAKTWIRNTLHTWGAGLTMAERFKLSELLYKQLLDQPTCPYTGDILVPRSNCNLDHKLATSKGGAVYDINNLQFVSRRYNQAKHDMTDQEFYDFCKLIILYSQQKRLS
jgi:hypothetical protein